MADTSEVNNSISRKPAAEPLNGQFHTGYEIRSEEVQEIMGEMPAWIFRWGISLVGILIIGIFIGSYFMKYPDIILSKVTISSINPPVKLIARSSAPIQRILVQNNKEVAPGQVICVLSNPAHYEDVERVTAFRASIDSSIYLFRIIDQLNIPSGLQLGELQAQYTELFQAVEQYRFFMTHNSYKAKVGHLLTQATYQAKLATELKKKDVVLQEQLKIQHNRYAIDSTLVTDRVISRFEFEEARKKLLDQKMNTEGNYSSILQSMLQEKEYQKNITETELQLQGEENNLQQRIRDASRRFQGAYAVWRQNYVLSSPISGKVLFFKYWKENQFIQSGEGVLMIVPSTQQYLARGTIGINGAGKIRAGQKVLIKLSAYPFEEYGMLRGYVTSRSTVSMDSTFALEISLNDGLKTNAAKQIPIQPQFEGIGEILTEDKSVFQRLFEKVYGKWRR
ncbi:HlyD family secretion protein [Chitinophaga polysaccharea]|uniref:HlyD family secretion protein n=1 Tax=Chitinophaga polysaccharea TaxID=1293035 RepID=UPI00115B3A22|nr:HlyD family efflux transporter periplasmic adaptor subunit [Chitinophaga polysaccharea]